MPKGKGFSFEELQKLRDNSPVGGLAGQLAEKELKRLERTSAKMTKKKRKRVKRRGGASSQIERLQKERNKKRTGFTIE